MKFSGWKLPRWFRIIPVFLILHPALPGLQAGIDTPGEPAFFLVSRFRPWDRARLASFGEVVEFGDDSALLRTTQARAELLAGAGAEIVRVMEPPALQPPPLPFRTLPGSRSEEPLIREIIDRVDRDDLHRLMEDLTGEDEVLIGGETRRILTRNSYQTEGIAWATQFAYERLEDLGLAVEYHDYSWNGNSWRNVVAEQPGTADPEQIYVICGHIDSMPTGPLAPGADDNASGSTAVLVSAAVLSRYSFENTIRYVLFTGEEQGLIGSQYYVNDCLAAGDSISGALNFDMIAYDGDGDGAMEVYSGTTETSNALGDLFLDTISVYGLDLDPAHYLSSPSWSDQYRFWQAGYPALVGIEPFGDFNPNYHTVNDTLAGCDLDYLTGIVRAAAGTLARLAVPAAVRVPAAGGDYNGDGTSDLAVFRPETGLWAARGVTRFYFGRVGDSPVPGDWRGDGTTAPAVFRPSSGLWAIRSLTRFCFGSSGDRPVPGGYGPGFNWSPGVFREENGLWAIRGLTRYYFGRSGDLPVSADYSGDGIRQSGIFRPSTGLWAIRGLTRFYFGPGLPLPDAYGAGEGDRAAVFAAAGRWRVRGLTDFAFGAEGDVPVPSNYRGDRVARPAVFRPAAGLWAVRETTRAYFGTAGDLPVSR